MANEIVTEIILELDKFKEQLKQAEGLAKTSGDKTGKTLGGSIEGAIGGVAKKVALAAAAGLVAVGAGLAKAVSEASAAEQATTRFNQALSAAGQFTKQASDDFLNYASGLQRTLGVSDDLITSNAALLVSVGKLSGQGLKDATRAALDLSAALGISLETATRLVSNAANGNVSALNRYGIEVRKAKDDSETFANALKQIGDRFGGAAAANANTYAGVISRLSLSFNDVFEEIGKIIIGSPKLVAAIGFIAEIFAKIADGVAQFGKSGDIAGNLLQSFVEFGNGLIQFVLPPLELFFNIVNVGLNTIKTAVLAIGGLFSDSLAEKAKASFDALAQSTNDIFNFDATAKVQELSTGLVNAINNANPIVAAASKSLADAVSAPVISATEVIKGAFSDAMIDIAVKTEEGAQRVGDSLRKKMAGALSAFTLGVANSFQSIGAALVKGENAFAAFGKSILGVFGDLAIQLGQFYFLLGLANLFLNPAAAAAQIAGGLALIILGGALKAISGSGGASAPAGGGVAAAGTGGAGELVAGDSGSANLTEPENREAGTAVNVIVQGSILDRRETGLAIAEVINESFSSNGVVFATGGA